MYLKVRKKSGKLQSFQKEKISRAVRKAGASVRNAERVANSVTNLASTVSWRKLRELAISELRKLDRKSANRFANFRKRK